MLYRWPLLLGFAVALSDTEHFKAKLERTFLGYSSTDEACEGILNTEHVESIETQPLGDHTCRFMCSDTRRSWEVTEQGHEVDHMGPFYLECLNWVTCTNEWSFSKSEEHHHYRYSPVARVSKGYCIEQQTYVPDKFAKPAAPEPVVEDHWAASLSKHLELGKTSGDVKCLCVETTIKEGDKWVSANGSLVSPSTIHEDIPKLLDHPMHMYLVLGNLRGKASEVESLTTSIELVISDVREGELYRACVCAEKSETALELSTKAM